MQFRGQFVSDQRGQRREKGSQKDANLSHTDRQIEEIQDVKYCRGGDHQTRVNGATDDSTQWIPGSVVKPVVEGVKTMVGQEFGGAVVEIGVEFVDHGLETEDGK